MRPEKYSQQDHCHEHEHTQHGSHKSHAPIRGGKYDTVPANHLGAVYTCPMHPEVRQITAGACPLCGMGLELESAAMTEEGPNPELVDFTHRFWVAAILTLPVFVLAMAPHVGLGSIRDFFGAWLDFLSHHES